MSGGQTGVDRAALDVALALGLPCGGWCPRGRRAENGRIPDSYPLREIEETSYSARTIRNVADADGTLILAFGPLTGGTLLTKNTAQKLAKPRLVVDLETIHDTQTTQAWLEAENIRVLNVAGPRASQQPRAYELATQFLMRLFSGQKKKVGEPKSRPHRKRPHEARRP